EYRSRSLPGDVEVARSLYKAWLLELLEKDDVAFKQPLVSAGTISPPGRVYRRISLSVSGRGTLPQFTQLLVEFYRVDLVHQVRSLRIKPIEDSRLLDVTLGVDALVIDGAPRADKLTLRPRDVGAGPTAEECAAAILARNLFAPANRPPQFDAVATQRVETDKTLTLPLTAKDEDPLDTVAFRLGEDAPAGASVSAKGELRFKTETPGEYRIPVVAFDDGLPSAIARRVVVVNVVKPPPRVVVKPESSAPPPAPKPHFEDGEFAFVSAVTEVNGRRQLWLDLRTAGKTLKLFEGDSFEVERLSGTIHRIHFDSIEVTAAGERRRFSLGENLSQGRPLAPLAESEGL
ncbi:MAG: hypothetical protein KDA41_13340, partial [Planctomycetales bacterium]|nr:hypothetical protein [Planctomycetales bacterium]